MPPGAFHCSPRVASIGLRKSDSILATLPSGAMSERVTDRLSSVNISPVSSPKNVTPRLAGMPAPMPQRTLLGRSMPLGSPRTAKPPNPDSSNAPRSLLTIASNIPSGLPVVVPWLLSPVGSLTMPRIANATGLCVASLARFDLASDEKVANLVAAVLIGQQRELMGRPSEAG